MTPKQKDQAWVESQRKKYRDASTGAYVTREYAEANPATTVGEAVSETGKSTEVVDAVLSAIMANPERIGKAMRKHFSPANEQDSRLCARLETLEADVALLIDTIKRMGE